MVASGNGKEPSRDLVSALEKSGVTVVRPHGTIIFEEGQQANGVLLVRKGKVKLSLHHGNGELTYRTVGSGYILGLPSTIGGRPYSLTAQAVENCEFVAVDREQVLELLSTRKQLSLQVVAILAEEVARMRKCVAAFTAEV